jgi:hypothetical protein
MVTPPFLILSTTKRMKLCDVVKWDFVEYGLTYDPTLKSCRESSDISARPVAELTNDNLSCRCTTLSPTLPTILIFTTASRVWGYGGHYVFKIKWLEQGVVPRNKTVCGRACLFSASKLQGLAALSLQELLNAKLLETVIA